MPILLVIFFLVFSGCEQEDPNPEKRDLVIQHLDNQKKEVQSQIEKIESEIKEHADGIKKAIPQTGQKKHHQRKLFEARSRKDFLLQQVQFLELRMKSRVNTVRDEYKLSRAKGAEWDPKVSFERYIASARPNRPKTWSVSNRVNQHRSPAKAEK